MKMYKDLLLATIVFINTQKPAECKLLSDCLVEPPLKIQKATDAFIISNPTALDFAVISESVAVDYFSARAKDGTTFDSLTRVDVVPRVLASNTESFSDLPNGIQIFIKKRNKPNTSYLSKLPSLEKRSKEHLSAKTELTFVSASTYILADKSKQYEVMVKYYGITNLPLIFDENANLIWVGSFQKLESLVNLDELSGGSNKISQEDLAFFINEFKSTSEFKEFTIKESTSGDEASLNTYADVNCYEFHLSKQTEMGDEIWILRYDGNKKLISSYNSAQL